jgi:hypothetical protein
MVVNMATELGCAVKPRAGADEDAPVEPFRTVVAVGSTGIGRDVIVSIRTVGGGSDVDADADLSFCVSGGSREADSGRGGE